MSKRSWSSTIDLAARSGRLLRVKLTVLEGNRRYTQEDRCSQSCYYGPSRPSLGGQGPQECRDETGTGKR